MSETIRNINLIIADRPYRLKINASEEETVRKAAGLIKHKLADLKKAYQAKDKQDYLAMAALMFCVDSLNGKGSDIASDEVNQKLGELDELLSVFLEK